MTSLKIVSRRLSMDCVSPGSISALNSVVLITPRTCNHDDWHETSLTTSQEKLGMGSLTSTLLSICSWPPCDFIPPSILRAMLEFKYAQMKYGEYCSGASSQMITAD